MNGFQTLGEVLGHAASGDNGAYQRGYLDAARGDVLMTKARQARDQAIAANQVRGKLVAAGIPDALADLLSTIFAAKYGNFGDVSGYLKGNQLRDIRTQALDAADRGDLNRENSLLGVMNGKPMTLSRVEGNVELNPSRTPEGQPFTPTSIGEALIGKANRAPAAGGKFNLTAPSNAAALAVLGGHPSGSPYLPPVIDPGKMKAFVIWQGNMAQHDPRYRDGDFAIGRYAQVLQDDAQRAARDKAAYAASLQEDATPPQPETDKGGFFSSIGHALGFGDSRAQDALPPAPRTPGARQIGTVYQTPKGPMKWMGNGWLPLQ